jgi:hypothetical protein
VSNAIAKTELNRTIVRIVVAVSAAHGYGLSGVPEAGEKRTCDSRVRHPRHINWEGGGIR